jgi:hypothetical protein
MLLMVSFESKKANYRFTAALSTLFGVSTPAIIDFVEIANALIVATILLISIDSNSSSTE